MLSFLAPAGELIRPYSSEIAVAIVVCLLVVLGNDINRVMRNLLKRQNFIVRTAAFVLLNAFGYGLFIVKASPYLTSWLRSLEHGLMFSVVIATFIALGMWAQKNRHV